MNDLAALVQTAFENANAARRRSYEADLAAWEADRYASAARSIAAEQRAIKDAAEAHLAEVWQMFRASAEGPLTSKAVESVP